MIVYKATTFLVVKKDRDFHLTDLENHKRHTTKAAANKELEAINGLARHLWHVVKVEIKVGT
jgi:hypothetical protein